MIISNGNEMIMKEMIMIMILMCNIEIVMIIWRKWMIMKNDNDDNNNDSNDDKVMILYDQCNEENDSNEK